MKTKYVVFSLILFTVSSWSPIASSKIFRNAYVSFELPQKWKCKIEGTEWVCSSSYKKQSREAVIILTAKETGPSDNIAAYETHLKQSRLLPSARKPIRSEIVHVKRRKIANQEWVDGMHKNSEIPNYYTRYLATTRNRVAILVSFSAHVKHYTKYSSDFFRAIQSLRVVAVNMDKKPNLPSMGTGGQIGSQDYDIPIGMDEDLPDELDSRGNSNKSKTMGLLLLLLAGGGYYFIKKKKKG